MTDPDKAWEASIAPRVGVRAGDIGSDVPEGGEVMGEAYCNEIYVGVKV